MVGRLITYIFWCHNIYAAEQLGLPLTPAYSEASGEEVLHGVNFASAAAGILDITGRNFVSTFIYDLV